VDTEDYTMAAQSLGLITVTTAGTKVRATSTQSDPTARIGIQAIQFQVRPANTGLIYVGTSALDKSTGAGVLAVLPAPASATTGAFASASFAEVNAPAGLNIADFYVDSTVNGDGVFISATVQ